MNCLDEAYVPLNVSLTGQTFSFAEFSPEVSDDAIHSDASETSDMSEVSKISTISVRSTQSEKPRRKLRYGCGYGGCNDLDFLSD